MAEWFEDWFNTDEYLNVYRHRNELEALDLVELILKNVSIPKDGSVLDLACGSGRHSVLFAQKGYDVTAVDLSENLLRVARSRSAELNLNIDFINADLRKFCINKKFDLAVNLFTSFGYFENDCENFALFKDAAGSLKDNGFFVLDYFNKEYLIENLIPESVKDLDDGKIIQKRKISGDRVVKDIIIKNNGTEKHFIESVRMYSKEELINAISNAGIRVTEIYGDFRGMPFHLENSPRIIIIAKKE